MSMDVGLGLGLGLGMDPMGITLDGDVETLASASTSTFTSTSISTSRAGSSSMDGQYTSTGTSTGTSTKSDGDEARRPAGAGAGAGANHRSLSSGSGSTSLVRRPSTWAKDFLDLDDDASSIEQLCSDPASPTEMGRSQPHAHAHGHSSSVTDGPHHFRSASSQSIAAHRARTSSNPSPILPPWQARRPRERTQGYAVQAPDGRSTPGSIGSSIATEPVHASSSSLSGYEASGSRRWESASDGHASDFGISTALQRRRAYGYPFENGHPLKPVTTTESDLTSMPRGFKKDRALRIFQALSPTRPTVSPSAIGPAPATAQPTRPTSAQEAKFRLSASTYSSPDFDLSLYQTPESMNKKKKKGLRKALRFSKRPSPSVIGPDERLDPETFGVPDGDLTLAFGRASFGRPSTSATWRRKSDAEAVVPASRRGRSSMTLQEARLQASFGLTSPTISSGTSTLVSASTLGSSSFEAHDDIPPFPCERSLLRHFTLQRAPTLKYCHPSGGLFSPRSRSWKSRYVVLLSTSPSRGFHHAGLDIEYDPFGAPPSEKASAVKGSQGSPQHPFAAFSPHSQAEQPTFPRGPAPTGVGAITPIDEAHLHVFKYETPTAIELERLTLTPASYVTIADDAPRDQTSDEFAAAARGRWVLRIAGRWTGGGSSATKTRSRTSAGEYQGKWTEWLLQLGSLDEMVMWQREVKVGGKAIIAAH